MILYSAGCSLDGLENLDDLGFQATLGNFVQYVHNNELIAAFYKVSLGQRPIRMLF